MVMNSQGLRRLMGHFATGVTVVTTRDKNGNPYGLTVNAFNSLSLNPPLVLVCLGKAAECYAFFKKAEFFAVNLLSERQETLSRRFATKGIKKFTGVKWHGGRHGGALLDGTLGYIECKVAHRYDGGDHTIYVGEVLSAVAAGNQPLIFFKGNYHRFPRRRR